MSGVELKPCGLSGSDNILVPLGSTTIGRGPFLGIADKRVSRNHAILEIEDGVFKVKPIHVNPTFFSKNGEGKLKPLKKDEWKNLENGDRISLTPNEHIFEVVVDDRPILSITQSPRSSIDSSSPGKSPRKTLEAPKQAIPEEENEDAPSPACRKLDFHTENNDSTAEEETNDNHSEDKHETDEKDELKQKEESKSDKNDEANLWSTESDTHKEYAKPVDRKRELPAWMTNTSSGNKKESSAPTPKAKNSKGTTSTPSRAKKRVSEEVDEDEEETDVKPPSKKRGAPARTPRKAAPVSYKEEEEEEEEEENYEPSSPKLKRRTSSRGRQTAKVNYVDDLEIYDDEDDDEYVATKDDEESDWEEEASPKKKGKSKMKSPRGTKGRRRRRQKSYSDEESSDEDVYIPKPTKRTAKILSNSQRSTDDDDGGRRKPSSRGKQESDEDEDTPVQENKERQPCVYGAKCYRKNRLHFNEFSHPKDDDYESGSERMDAAEKDDEDQPECLYGADCYRTNLEHKRQYRHPPSSGRPKRQAAKGKKKARDDSDEDGPNTYDYEDSFLDDEIEEEETPKGKSEDDSDWGPEPGEDSEDLSQLVKEAKGFVRNKKLQK